MILSILIYRSVEPIQRSLALGLQTLLIRGIGTVPGPIIFGYLIDITCLLWRGEKNVLFLKRAGHFTREFFQNKVAQPRNFYYENIFLNFQAQSTRFRMNMVEYFILFFIF